MHERMNTSGIELFRQPTIGCIGTSVRRVTNYSLLRRTDTLEPQSIRVSKNRLAEQSDNQSINK